jgi:hypothetical protein
MSSRYKYGEDTPGSFALIKVPAGVQPHGEVIATGSLSSVTQSIKDSKARNDALDLLKRADEATEQEREREQCEQQVITEGIRALADSVAKLSSRLDALERSRDVRHQLDVASEATEKMLALPKDAPADETHQPGGELHALGPKDPTEHQPAATDTHVGKDRVLHIEKSRH